METLDKDTITPVETITIPEPGPNDIYLGDIATNYEIRTEYDELGRSWVVIDGVDINELQISEWIGGIPDTWKRR